MICPCDPWIRTCAAPWTRHVRRSVQCQVGTICPGETEVSVTHVITSVCQQQDAFTDKNPPPDLALRGPGYIHHVVVAQNKKRVVTGALRVWSAAPSPVGPILAFKTCVTVAQTKGKRQHCLDDTEVWNLPFESTFFPERLHTPTPRTCPHHDREHASALKMGAVTPYFFS